MSVYFRVDHPSETSHTDPQPHLGDAMEAIVLISIALVLMVGLFLT